LYEPILNLYETGKMSTLTEVLFLERCLNLLKPGGRMGIVLPEGVLNNTNLQKIRDFIESRAKILLIVSIPQDVFIASGATVKPSLLFFKKFTPEEAQEYASITERVTKMVNEKYATKVEAIEKQLNKKGKDAFSGEAKKELRQELKVLQEKIEEEIQSEVKTQFNYQVPIAEVEKAGISTTGTVIENELVPLAGEFKKYRQENKLWQSTKKEVKYELENDAICRTTMIDGQNVESEILNTNIKS